MSEITPPDIWTFEACNAVNTDGINISKEYKPSGQFYQDTATLLRLYGLKPHPIFKVTEGADKKEPSSVFATKYRLDNNTLKVLFKVLETCPHITTLK
jgi:hypothetical protein